MSGALEKIGVGLTEAQLLEGLEEKQVAAYWEMKEEMASVEDVDGHVTARSLLRYLRARDYNVKKSSAMMKATLAWRAEYRPWEISARDPLLEQEAVTGKQYRHGYDRHGHPVIVMRPGLENFVGDSDARFRYWVYTMEAAVRDAEARGCEKLVWLIDYKGWSMKSTDSKTSKATLSTVQNHYPERLFVGLMLDPPFAFWLFWKILTPFMADVTKKKVQFVNNKQPARTEEMGAIIPLECLECDLGGTDEYKYDHEAYWASEIAAEDEAKVDAEVGGSSTLDPGGEPASAGAASADAIPVQPEAGAGSGADEAAETGDAADENAGDVPEAGDGDAAGDAAGGADETAGEPAAAPGKGKRKKNKRKKK